MPDEGIQPITVDGISRTFRGCDTMPVSEIKKRSRRAAPRNTKRRVEVCRFDLSYQVTALASQIYHQVPGDAQLRWVSSRWHYRNARSEPEDDVPFAILESLSRQFDWLLALPCSYPNLSPQLKGLDMDS